MSYTHYLYRLSIRRQVWEHDDWSDVYARSWRASEYEGVRHPDYRAEYDF